MSFKLSDFLLRTELVSSETLVSLTKQSQLNNHGLFKTILSSNTIPEDTLLAKIGNELNIPFESLNRNTIDIKIAKCIPETLARKEHVIPLFKFGNTITLATCNPFITTTIETIECFTQCVINPVLTQRSTIDELIAVGFSYDSQTTSNEISPLTNLFDMGIQVMSESKASETEPEEIAQEAPITALVNTIITQAINEKASDIHIEPEENTISIRFRIDGLLKEVMTPPKQLAAPIISRIKILAKLDITETRKPQDGRLTFELQQKKIDFRISTIRTVSGEKMVLRLLDKSDAFVDMENLGLNTNDFQNLENLIQATSGIILVCGPTGAGKTSTLYSCLSKINSQEKNIITIEDPVEFNLDGINQIPVNPKIGVDFISGLSAIVRQDPDIIMVGEIRNIETASIAIQAALTGHLVFSTIHTRGAAGSITRLLNMGVQPFLINSALIAIIGQRLVRRICKNCKIEYTPENSLNKKEQVIIQKLKKSNPTTKFFKGSGCKFCDQSGYKGRIGIFEILTLNEETRDLITQKSSSEKIKQAAIQNGMTLMISDGLEKIKTGITTVEEIARVLDV